MNLEVAILNVIPEKTVEFEAAFEIAQEIISSIKGHLGHQLQQCLEIPNQYILLVKREKPFPVVEHYSMKYEKKL